MQACHSLAVPRQPRDASRYRPSSALVSGANNFIRVCVLKGVCMLCALVSVVCVHVHTIRSLRPDSRVMLRDIGHHTARRGGIGSAHELIRFREPFRIVMRSEYNPPN